MSFSMRSTSLRDLFLVFVLITNNVVDNLTLAQEFVLLLSVAVYCNRVLLADSKEGKKSVRFDFC